MVSLAVMIGEAAINALAFSRSNYLFSKLSHHGQELDKLGFINGMREYHQEFLRLER